MENLNKQTNKQKILSSHILIFFLFSFSLSHSYALQNLFLSFLSSCIPSSPFLLSFVFSSFSSLLLRFPPPTIFIPYFPFLFSSIRHFSAYFPSLHYYLFILLSFSSFLLPFLFSYFLLLFPPFSYSLFLRL